MKKVKKRIMVSVTEKSKLNELAQLNETSEYDWEFVSTGGTAKDLRKCGLDVIDVADVTGFPEMMDGRLKTIHPLIAGPLLAVRDNEEHMAAVKSYRMTPIDVLVCNLYNFQGEPGIENIDIGGPNMIRAAAKNYSSVTVVVDPKDYRLVVDEFVLHGDTRLQTRARLAAKAFKHTGVYDMLIGGWMDEQILKPGFAGNFPD